MELERNPLREQDIQVLSAWVRDPLILVSDTELLCLNEAARQLALDPDGLRGLLLSGEKACIEVPQTTGGTRWLEIRTRRAVWQGQPALLAELRDYTQEQLLVRHISRISSARQLMLETSQRITSLDRIEDIYAFVLKNALRAMENCHLCSILLLCDDQTLRLAAQAGYIGDLSQVRIRLEDSFLSRATNGRLDQIVNIPDLSIYYDKYYPITVSDGQELMLKSTLSAPLHMRGKLYGMINFDALETNAFCEEDTQLLDFLRNNIEVALSNRMCYEERVFLSRHDPLTGMDNRAYFEERYRESLQLARQKANLFVVMFDLDDLKKVNDTLGHASGDEAIIRFARKIRAAQEPKELLARIGGDEFAGVFFARKRSQLEERLVRILRSLEMHPLRVGGVVWPLSFSYGIVGPIQSNESLVTLLRTADSQMYAHKRHRKTPLTR